MTIVKPSRRLAEDVPPTFDDGREVTIDADAVILAAPRRARQDLLRALEYSVDELHVIGDAVSPRTLYAAIHEGFRLGARI